MKAFFYAVVGAGLFCCTPALAAQDDARAPDPLDRYGRQIGDLVRRYYPDATVAVSHDETLDADRVHFEYNTELFIMRYHGKDGSWQEPQKVIGPYVGGIWCDLVLRHGRYKGDVEGAEDGVTEMGPDFYSYLIAPYSKERDQHLTVKLRFPGGTPPEFLKEFTALARDFQQYVDEPKQAKSGEGP